MKAWVSATMPGVTRRKTSCTVPARAAMRASRSISSRQSTTTMPTPAATAARSSSEDLLLPWNTIRPAGIPAASATASSPPLQMSRCSPSSWIQRTSSTQQKALAA